MRVSSIIHLDSLLDDPSEHPPFPNTHTNPRKLESSASLFFKVITNDEWFNHFHPC